MIRRATLDDVEALRRVRLAALRDSPDYFARSWEEEASQPRAFWERRVRSNAAGIDTVGFFAVEEGADVGLVAGIRHGTGVELASMWVAPTARGHGHGRALTEAVCAWALERGCDRVGLTVREGNDAAIWMYARCGFDTVAERPDFVPSYGCEVYMLRVLADR